MFPIFKTKSASLDAVSFFVAQRSHISSVEKYTGEVDIGIVSHYKMSSTDDGDAPRTCRAECSLNS